jgi:hypothetical protein
MNRYFRFTLMFAVCFALVSCYETISPIKSASFTRWQDGKIQSTAQQLTPEQTAKLSEWLQNHRWGWHPVAATYLPAIQVSVSHVDGTTSSANLMQRVLVVRQNQRSLSEAESNELHSMIGEKSGH